MSGITQIGKNNAVCIPVGHSQGGIISFLFHFNIDATAIIPFVAVEGRADGKVRMQAPAFGKDNDQSPTGAMGGMAGMEGMSGMGGMAAEAK